MEIAPKSGTELYSIIQNKKNDRTVKHILEVLLHKDIIYQICLGTKGLQIEELNEISINV